MSEPEHLDVKNRTTCEFDAACTSPTDLWTSCFGEWYPVCKEHLDEAVSF